MGRRDREDRSRESRGRWEGESGKGVEVGMVVGEDGKEGEGRWVEEE